MEQIIGKRQTGKTTKLIQLCKKLNEEHGINDTVIVAKNRQDARLISQTADAMGYKGMPFPVVWDDIIRCRPTFYKKLLIDDVDMLIQQLVYPWEVVGYTLSDRRDRDGEL